MYTPIHEELEAHLHPELQIQMAELLVALSNANLQILVSTHSDVITEMIGYILRISQIKNKSSFNFTFPHVSIQKEEIALVNLQEKESGTISVISDIVEDGFANEGFENTWDTLQQIFGKILQEE